MDYSSLQSRASTAYIPLHRTQLHPRIMNSFASSASTSQIPRQQQDQQQKLKWLILLASLLTLPFLFYLFTTAHKIHQSSKFQASKPKSFGILIHSTPTGSRVRVFEFLNEGRIPFIGLDGSGSGTFKIRPGLSGFEEDPEAAGGSILPLIEFAKQWVPKSEWGNTKVQLMAGGEMDKLGKSVRNAILESCKRALRASGFLFKDEWARVIGGQEEGIYAWVAVNYALGTLGGEPQETIGIVELGGASMQVAFAPRELPPMQFLRIIKLAGITYNLYTESLPHFGQDAAWDSVQQSREMTSFSNAGKESIGNPCIPRGYLSASNASDAQLSSLHPAGNFSMCRSKLFELLKMGKEKCLHPPCEIISSLLIELGGEPIPPEKFFYIFELFGLVPKATLSEVEAAGKHYCEDDWDTLKKRHQSIDDLDLSRYCFSSAYILALLHDNLGIPINDKRIGFANHGGTIPLDWTLGAFILQTMLEPREMEPDMGKIVENESVMYFSVFAVLLIAVLAAFFVSKWRKPQLKTIYDLEKGRYIVTRIPR